jgi:rod shape-determining protein MreD
LVGTTWMRWTRAALGATVAALLETTVGPHVAAGDGGPHLVLVLGVVWTVAAGLESGLAWAFAGGLALDVLAQRPIGSSAFILLVCLAAAAILATALSRVRPFSPIPLSSSSAS